MTSTIAIRPASQEDCPVLWPLLQGMGQTDSENSVRERVAALIGRDDHALVVAINADALVGYAWVQDYGPHLRSGYRTARLHDLFVTPEARRQGAGTGLFAEIRNWASGRGVRWLEWQANQQAVPFYERLGLRGDPCPDPTHPFFEIDFGEARQ